MTPLSNTSAAAMSCARLPSGANPWTWPSRRRLAVTMLDLPGWRRLFLTSRPMVGAFSFSMLNERPFDRVCPRRVGRAAGKSPIAEYSLKVAQHRGTATEHDAVVCRIELREPEGQCTV